MKKIVLEALHFLTLVKHYQSQMSVNLRARAINSQMVKCHELFQGISLLKFNKCKLELILVFLFY